MAYKGLKFPVFAPIEQETEGQKITYGKAVVLGRAISAEIEVRRSEATLYADDAAAEHDNGITGGSITFGVSEINKDAETAVLGRHKETVSDGHKTIDVYVDTDAGAPYGGFGYYRVMQVRGVLHIDAYWIYKTQLGAANESAQTRGENTEWQTPSVSGVFLATHQDDTGVAMYREHAYFDTEAEAIAWIKGHCANDEG